jgi:hypothetical protein
MTLKACKLGNAINFLFKEGIIKKQTALALAYAVDLKYTEGNIKECEMRVQEFVNNFESTIEKEKI